MKKICLSESRIHWRVKITIAIIVLAIFLVGGFFVTRSVNKFFDGHYLQFNKIVEVILKRPFEVKERKPQIVEVILDYPDEIDTPLEKYICDKFGTYDCKSALAIAKAESGLKEDNYHYNSNGTIDIGIFQVNEVHWVKDGCSPAELFIAKSNVDCAYQIWKQQGWEPWVVYQKGSYIKHLE